MRKAQKDPQGWLTRLVKTMMGQLRVREAVLSHRIDLDRGEIFQEFCHRIHTKLSEMGAATRGEIANLGLSVIECTNNDLSAGAYVIPAGSGRYIVTQVATVVIVNRMYELLCGRETSDLSQYETKDPTQEMHDVTGRGSMGHGRQGGGMVIWDDER